MQRGIQRGGAERYSAVQRGVQGFGASMGRGNLQYREVSSGAEWHPAELSSIQQSSGLY
jgi:hypothetical protein